MHRAYIDANIFIYAIEQKREETDVGAQCRRLFELVRSRRLIGITSELTLAEVLVEPSRQGDDGLMRAYLALLGTQSSALDLRPITRGILIESVAYRARAHPAKPGPDEQKRNFLPDAIHVVTAIATGATHYVGSDQRIRLPGGMKRLDPRGPGLTTFLDRVA